MLNNYKCNELRDLYIYLILIFLCYQSLSILDLKLKYIELRESYIESEMLQNEINAEIIKKIIKI